MSPSLAAGSTGDSASRNSGNKRLHLTPLWSSGGETCPTDDTCRHVFLCCHHCAQELAPSLALARELDAIEGRLAEIRIATV